MILEALEWLATPCPRALRDTGYLSELVSIGARHRRCRAAWADHLARSRQAILDAARRTAGRRRALVLGSGRLLDVPLAELATLFERVTLVDLVHPLAARWRARRHANVTLVSRDVTGIIGALRRWQPGQALPIPRPLDIILEPDVDFIISLNLLSQLGVLPIEWIEKRAGPAGHAAAHALSAALTRVHLDDLASCRAHVCLIGDVEWWRARADGTVVERWSSIDDIEAPPAIAEWIWPIAPAPEADPNLSEFRRVIVAYDPGKPAQAG
jgi:hypothetical protein